MRRFLGTLILVLVIFGCVWALWNKDKIDNPADALRLARNQFGEVVSSPQSGAGSGPGNAQFASWSQADQADQEVIRIATFNVQVFSPEKSGNRMVRARLTEICRKFDLIALQDIRSTNKNLLPDFVRELNSRGGQFGFVISPRVGRSGNKEQTAYVFDQSRIQLDDSFSYTINDPDDVLQSEPFVGWFRTRGPHMEHAFTFTLANFHLDSQQPELELAYLAELHRIIRKDGRGEDDVILLGDFNANAQSLEVAGQKAGLEWVLANTATNTRGTAQYDNIIYDPLATDEFTGRAGVYDFMKQMNLTLNEALAISDHMPVWAEFSIYEAGRPKRVAEQVQDLIDEMESR